VRNDDVWVVVPTYNEAPVVRQVLAELCAFFPNIVAVDDCSTDTSAQEIKAAGVRLVSHPINMGAGGALQTGVDFALLDPDAKYFVSFDSDGQHRAQDAAAMVDRIRRDDVDVLIGSRFLGQANNMTATRRLTLKLARWFEFWSTGIRLTDAHNGLRVFNRTFASALQLRMTDMAWATEFLSRVATTGARIGEHPVTIEYTEYSRAKGQHSINSVNIGVDIMINRFLRGPH
jgi:glycosyltransferase involved in cell wall biosynthesis